MFASFSVEIATALAGRSVWIFLAARGFSRPNPDFSMGYAEKALKVFSRGFFAFCWEAAGTEPGVETSGSLGLFMGQA
jgi:hypothetical protein